jgi:hypothetical protein
MGGARGRRLFERITEDECGEGLGGIAVAASGPVRVRAEREAEAGVTDAVADELGVQTGIQGRGGVRVPVMGNSP